MGPFLVIILQARNIYLHKNLENRMQSLTSLRFFIGYWILKRGWIFILAPFLFFRGLGRDKGGN